MIEPRDIDAYKAWVAVAGRSSDLPAMSWSLIALTLLDSRPLTDVRPLLERLVTHVPGSRVLPLLWRLVAEQDEFPFEEQLERRLAREPKLSPAQRQSYLKYLFRRSDIGRPSLPNVVCGMPKSASTFISGLVAEMTGLPIDTPHNSNDFLGTGFDKGRIWDLCQTDAVVHGHLAATPRTLCYFRLLDVRPIITVRNIFDALRSYADHITVREEDGRSEAWLNFAIMRMAALYVEFYATWVRARNLLDVLWVSYDDIEADPGGLVERIRVHLGPHAVSSDGVARAHAMMRPAGMNDFQKRSLMFNKGRSGRGRGFNVSQRAIVRAMYPIYPDIDFRPIDPELDVQSGMQRAR